MSRVLDYIDRKREDIAQLPFLLFVQDRSIDPRQRLGFAPCLAPLAMGFSDFMALGLRDASSKDELQQVLNKHTQVDDRHWEFFVHDLKALGFTEQGINLSEAVLFLWGAHCVKTRQLTYALMGMTRKASPIMRLVILQSIEVISDTGFRLFREVGTEFTQKTGQMLMYFGQHHQDVEDEHEEMGAISIRSMISSYPWTPAEEAQALALADETSACYMAAAEDLVAYALKAIEQGPWWPLTHLRSSAR